MSTVATSGLLDFHVNVVSSVVLLGLIVATSVSACCSSSVSVVLFKLTLSIGTGFLVTVTVHVASFPFTVVTVIVALPSLTAVTFPLLSTVATSGLLDFHVNVVSSVVSLGLIVATSVSASCSSNVKVVLSKLTLSIGIFSLGLFTVILHSALLPFTVVTVIVATPSLTAVTFPSWSTVATLVLLDNHVNVVSSVVSLGLIVALNVWETPSSNVIAVRFRWTDVIWLITVILHVSVNPLLVLTVIIALPGFLAVTTPVELTVATSGLFDSHVNVLSSVVSLGVTVALNGLELSFLISKSLRFNDTFVIGALIFVTVTSLLALSPLLPFTIIVALPSVIPVTTPFASTVAIPGLFDCHDNDVLSTTLYGDKIATYLDDSLTSNVNSGLSKFIPVVINVKL